MSRSVWKMLGFVGVALPLNPLPTKVVPASSLRKRSYVASPFKSAVSRKARAAGGSTSVLGATASVPRPIDAVCASPPGSAPPFQVQVTPSSVERQRVSLPTFALVLVGLVGSATSPAASQVSAPTQAR